MNLSGKRVLITGGGTGLGADLARGFADTGAEIVIAGRRMETLAKVASRPGICAVTADVTVEAEVRQMFAQAGPVDIVIANAGAADTAPFGKVTLAHWQHMLAVNLTGVFLTLREGMNQMQGWGRLIAVASTAALRGYAYVAPYAAAKHGVVGLTRSLALELAQRDITANALCPGFLDTEMTARSIANIVEKTGKTPEQAREFLAVDNADNRLIKPGEVTRAALDLCGPASGATNGQAIEIGGRSTENGIGNGAGNRAGNRAENKTGARHG